MKPPPIAITQDLIDLGIPFSPAFCPISQAIRRDRPDFTDISVGADHVHYSYRSDPGRCFEVGLPWKCRTFIRRFDSRQPVKPFTFRLGVS